MSQVSSDRAMVSVIVPAYNYAHFLPSTLDSVIQQTYPSWECIVVDDGSTDNTAEVVRNYAAKDARIQYVFQMNRGLAGARNTGIEQSRGQFIQFLDADDLIEEHKLEHQVDYLDSHERADIVYGSARYFRTERPNELMFSIDGAAASCIPDLQLDDPNVLATLIARNIMPVNCPLVRRRVVEAIGLFDTELRRVEDWDYWIRCAASGLRFQYVGSHGTLALIRIHGTSMSQNWADMLREMLKLREKVARAKLDGELRRLNCELLATCLGQLGIEEIAAGQFAPGLSKLLRAGVMSKRTRVRLKWLCCLGALPFMESRQVKTLALSSITGYVRRLLARGAGAPKSDISSNEKPSSQAR